MCLHVEGQQAYTDAALSSISASMNLSGITQHLCQSVSDVRSCWGAGITSVSSETEERLHAAAVSMLPSLAVGNTSLNPAASKVLNHRVPMGGGGYMQAHSYIKPAAGKPSNAVSKGVRQPVPSARSSAYKYKNALSSNASSISSAALGGKSASKYISPYSQSYLNVLRVPE